MKTYRGIREPLCHVRVVEDAGAGSASASLSVGEWRAAEHELAVPRELVSSALVPFDWGLDGPGTHYLAVALLAELLGPADRNGIKAALPFMRRFLSRLPKDDFEISETIFRAFLSAVGVAGPAMLSARPPTNGARPDSSDGASAQGRSHLH